MKRALVILHPGFEEVEALMPVDLLIRAEIEVMQAAVGGKRLVKGRNGITVQATHHLEDIANTGFDLIVLPGGPGINQVRKNRLICELLQRQNAAGKWIGCICAAPLLLLDAGLTKALRYTCHPAVETELQAAQAEAVVEDGNIITSRGVGTATEFALKLVARLTDEGRAKAVADSICWSPLY